MLCQRCAKRDAEVFQTQRVAGISYERNLCSVCAQADYGVFLGALIKSQIPGAAPLSAEEERELRRVLDNAAPPEDEG
jgi:protein-arginine kinase activator protein McsA